MPEDPLADTVDCALESGDYPTYGKTTMANGVDLPKNRLRFFDPRRASGRLFLAVLLGLVMAAGVPAPPLLRGVVAWDAGAALLIALGWNVILRSTPEITKKRAAAEDPGRKMVWVLAVISSLFSLFAAIVVLRHAFSIGAQGRVWAVLGLAAVALSWVVTHTSYSFRYAHLYYWQKREFGLQFPGEDKPCDIDFAYFAFGIGMCFQVGDVAVTCTRIRRTVLFHCLLSFVHNTVVVALGLNVVFGFLDKG